MKTVFSLEFECLAVYTCPGEDQEGVAVGPDGAWVAVTGKVTWEPFLLGAGVGLWIAGFDVIYAFMDVS